MVTFARWIACAVLLAGSTSVAPEAHGATYRDEANGFSLDAPRFAGATAGASQVLTIAGPNIDGFSPNCNVQIQFMDGSLADYEKLSAGQFESLGWTMIDSRPTKISNRPALRWHYAGQMRGNDFEWLAVVVARESKFYLLTCTARAATFKDFREAFEQSIESFAID